MYIGWLLLYGFIDSVSGMLSRRLDQPYIFFALFISLYWAVLLKLLYRKNQWKNYGISLPKYSEKKTAAEARKTALLCLLFAAANLLVSGEALVNTGGNLLPPWPEAGLYLLTVALLVWGEEVFFRGVLPAKLAARLGEVNGRRISVLLFALFHLLNVFSIGSWRYVLVQTLCAAVLGAMLLQLRTISGSLFPGVGIHFLINLTAVQEDLTISQSVIYLFVSGICLLCFKGKCGVRKTGRC